MEDAKQKEFERIRNLTKKSIKMILIYYSIIHKLFKTKNYVENK
jgi:hypothetical protein